MTDLDDCDPWLQQAWVELKAPLTRGEVAPLPHGLDAVTWAALLQALGRGDIEAARQLCLRWANQGQGPSDVAHILALILPVIEHIEADWQADRRSYTDTLYAFWNVQRLLQTWGKPEGTHIDAHPGSPACVGRVLMASIPGSLHHLGALVVADHFRTHGWQVQTLIDAPAEQLIQAVRDEPCDVVGLSVGHDAGLQGLPDLIRTLRSAAAPGAPRLLLGGPVFAQASSSFDWLGADGIATSAQHALILCGHWVEHKHH